jgi:hypothetical protein
VQDLAVIKYELAFFWQIAESWNRSPGAWSAFPKFLEIVYSQRVIRESAEARETPEDDLPDTLPFRKPANREEIRTAA